LFLSRKPHSISAGSVRSSRGIFRPPARRPANGWDGTPPGPASSPISKPCATSRREKSTARHTIAVTSPTGQVGSWAVAHLPSANEVRVIVRDPARLALDGADACSWSRRHHEDACAAGGYSFLLRLAQALMDMFVAKDGGLDNAEPRTSENTTPATFRNG